MIADWRLLCIQLYAIDVPVIWDDEKRKRNLEKHGIRFADAALVLEDPYELTITDDESDSAEQRFVTMGADALGRVLVVVYALPWRRHSAHLGAAG